MLWGVGSGRVRRKAAEAAAEYQVQEECIPAVAVAVAGLRQAGK